ncbi:MAG TPA: exosortase/archaeosortase family protein [Tepidisphaeraceae bacterium]|jgi:exosortase|nr:exosortase/archaeosortase family protein [Tepidisphaeraceae bacterium]
MSLLEYMPVDVVAEPAPERKLKASWFWPARTNRWTRWHVGMASIMALLGVLATLDAWRDIYHLAAKDEEYSHIFLVPIVAFCMVFVRRHRFRYCKPSGTSLGFVFVIIGWAMTTFGFYSGTQSLWHGGAVILVVGCAMSILGKHMLLRFFPAVAVLVFLIPVPGFIRQQIAIPLEEWTARISQFAFQLVNIPVQRNANLLSLNNQPVNIAEACNGLRMVFALVLITYAFCFGLPLRNSVRFFLLAASPLATIFCNVLRILPTIWIYGYHGKAVGNLFHTYSGWLMLPISFLMLLAIIKVLRWAMIPVMRYTLAS